MLPKKDKFSKKKKDELWDGMTHENEKEMFPSNEWTKAVLDHMLYTTHSLISSS